MKIMAIVDRHGLPLSVSTHAANHHDRLVWPRLSAIQSARLPKRSAGRSRRSRASSRATSCRAGTIRRFTPPEPIDCAGGVKRRIERDRALRTFVVDRLAEGSTPEQISGSLKGGNEPRLRAVGCETIYAFIYRAAQQADHYGVTSRAITNAAARADRDLRKMPSRIASPSTNGPSMSRPEPRAATRRVTSSFVSVHGQCSFSMSANRA